MFNFYVVLAGHDKVSDVGRASIFARNFNSRLLQTKSTKRKVQKDVPKTLVLTENQFEVHLSEKTQWKTKNPEPYRYQSIMTFVNSKS